jgi:hypothetical protein
MQVCRKCERFHLRKSRGDVRRQGYRYYAAWAKNDAYHLLSLHE